MPKRRSRLLVEQCVVLDVSQLHRAGALISGAPEHRRHADRLTINGVPVQLSWTPCNYGGERPWFCCPECDRRCAKLINYRGQGFRCRGCYGAGYAVENLTPEWRVRRRIKKLEGRLAEDFERPKNMHRSTYQRLYEEIEDKEEMADGLLIEKLARRWPDLVSSF